MVTNISSLGNPVEKGCWANDSGYGILKKYHAVKNDDLVKRHPTLRRRFP
jgi:hypothetical protein